MRLTTQDLRQLGVVDQIIPEPLGGATGRPARRSLRSAMRSSRRSSRCSSCRPPNCASAAGEKFLGMGNGAAL